MTETQGLVVTEAMTYGLPAVVVHGGGASAAVTTGVNGFVVGNKPRDMAEKILNLLRDPLLYESMSEGALETSKSCTVTVMVSKMLEVYEKVLRRSTVTEAANVR
jgi:glycosyltransferase involved in cell wall biosynthesis